MPAVQMDPDEVDAAAQGMQARARDLADAERLGSLDVPPAVAAALGALTSGEERLTGAAGLGLSEIADALMSRASDVRGLDRFVP